jgi:hypothetical protein
MKEDWRKILREHIAKHSVPRTDGRRIDFKAVVSDQISKEDMERFIADMAPYFTGRKGE